jgi:hypothetical protein
VRGLPRTGRDFSMLGPTTGRRRRRREHNETPPIPQEALRHFR